MKKETKYIKNKNSFFKMYGEGILIGIFPFIIITMVIFLYVDCKINPSHYEYYNEWFGKFAIVFGGIIAGIFIIVLAVGLVKLIYYVSLFLYRRKKLPLNEDELKNLNITNPDEYVEFVYNYLLKSNIFIMKIQKKKKKKFYVILLNSARFLYALIIMNTSMIVIIISQYLMIIMKIF